MFEVQDDPNLATRDSKIIQNLADMFVRDGIRGFDLDDRPPLDLQVGNEVVNVLSPVLNGIHMLTIKRQVLPLEFHAQRPFIGFFLNP